MAASIRRKMVVWTKARPSPRGSNLPPLDSVEWSGGICILAGVPARDMMVVNFPEFLAAAPGREVATAAARPGAARSALDAKQYRGKPYPGAKQPKSIQDFS